MEFEGFMYLNIEHPVVAWNVYRGVLCSQQIVAKGAKDSSPLSLNTALMFIEQHWERFDFEITLEVYRVIRCPEKNSRLTGLFVFGDAESALAAAEDEAWGSHINTDYLTDVGVWAIKPPTRLDANWISWMLVRRHNQAQDWMLGIGPYWAGEVCPHFATPIWELLIDGMVTIWGAALREQAYARIKARDPRSVSILEQSRLAARLGSELGHLSAFFTAKDGRPLVSFFMAFGDATNKAYTERLNAFIASKCEPVNFADLAVGGATFRIPDFAAFSYAFPIRTADAAA